MFKTRRIGIALGLLGVSVALAVSPALAAASTLPQGSEPVNLDPADFSTRIDNPYFPFVPGDKYVYRETDGTHKEKVVLSVSDKTRLIANSGITAPIVHDRVTERGKVIGHIRLVRPGFRRQRVVSRRGHSQCRRTDQQSLRLVRGRRGRRPARRDHARRPRESEVSPGVLRRRG